MRGIHGSETDMGGSKRETKRQIDGEAFEPRSGDQEALMSDEKITEQKFEKLLRFDVSRSMWETSKFEIQIMKNGAPGVVVFCS